MMGLYAIGFWLVDVPIWALAALICGGLHVVPLMGAVLGLLVPIVFALAGGGYLGQILQIVAVFVVAQLLETFYLTPKILGRELSLRPLLVFVSVLIGGASFGVVGALLAPLLVAVGLVLGRAVSPRAKAP